MGVKGFFSFLRDLKAFVPINLLSEAEKFLNDTGKQKKKLTIVVDGGSFVHFLIDKYQLHSNDLAQFYQVAQNWLKHFVENNIKLLFIFDGVVPQEKYREFEERRQQRWTKVNEILQNPECLEKDKKDPSTIDLYQFLLIQILHKEKIEVNIAQGEADRYIAYICKKRECYGVLSSDTDFLIFGTKLLISSSLSFENGCLWVHVYDPKYISDNVLKISEERLPLLAALIGNDFIFSEELQSIYQFLKIPNSNNSQKPINALIHCVASITPQKQNELFQEFPKLKTAHDFYLLPEIGNDKDKDAWQLTCDFYQDNDKITQAFNTTLKKYLNFYQWGFFSPGLVHLHCFSKVWLPIVIAETDESKLKNGNSVYEATEKLRKHIYEFLCPLYSNSKSSPNKRETQTKQQKATQTQVKQQKATQTQVKQQKLRTQCPNNIFDFFNTQDKSEVNSESDQANKTKIVTIKEKIKNSEDSFRVQCCMSSNPNKLSQKDKLNRFIKCLTMKEDFQPPNIYKNYDSTLHFASLLLRYIAEQRSFCKDQHIIFEEEFDTFLLHILILDQNSKNIKNTNNANHNKQDENLQPFVISERYTTRGMYLCSLWNLILLYGFALNSVCECPFDPKNLHLEILFDPTVFFETLKCFRQTSSESEISPNLQKSFKELKTKILKGITLPKFSVYLQMRDSTQEIDNLTNRFQQLK